jgi:hypothetical protein
MHQRTKETKPKTEKKIKNTVSWGTH